MNELGGIGVAEPDVVKAIRPTSSRAADGIHCARPPMFCTHLPVFIPTMLKTSAIVRSTSEAPAAYTGLCSRCANRVPKMYSAKTTVESVSVGKYVMFEAQ